jgi:hypothetical protein
MIGNGLYDEGYLVTIAPALNYHVQDAADAYRARTARSASSILHWKTSSKPFGSATRRMRKPCIAVTAISGWSTASWN